MLKGFRLNYSKVGFYRIPEHFSAWAHQELCACGSFCAYYLTQIEKSPSTSLKAVSRTFGMNHFFFLVPYIKSMSTRKWCMLLEGYDDPREQKSFIHWIWQSPLLPQCFNSAPAFLYAIYLFTDRHLYKGFIFLTYICETPCINFFFQNLCAQNLWTILLTHNLSYLFFILVDQLLNF